MINRLRNLKLIHQIGLVILIGFSLSYILSLYLLSSEKSKTLSFLSSSGAIQRVISVADILRHTPVNLHPSIIRASRSSDLDLSLSAVPRITETSPNSNGGLLIKQFNDVGLHNVHLSLIKQIRPIMNMSDMHNAMMSNVSMREMQFRQRGYVATIDGSVQLDNGSWLNFSSGVQQGITQWSTGVLLSLAIVMLSTVVCSVYIIHRSLKPVRSLGNAAKAFAQNRQVTPVSTECPKDLLPTIVAFNEMQTRLSNYIQERTKLLAAISHDLRTPLTSLRLRMEFIDDNEDKQQMLQTISVMEKMLQATMSFAKDENHREERQRTNINSLLQAIVDEYADKGITVDYIESTPLVESVPPLSIRRIMENLINNSVQYGGENNSITVKALKRGGYLEVSVIDTGIGIDDDKLEEVIKPFTRLDSARDTDSSNVGLGLSITKALTNVYGGTLILKKNHPKGLICQFTIGL